MKNSFKFLTIVSLVSVPFFVSAKKISLTMEAKNGGPSGYADVDYKVTKNNPTELAMTVECNEPGSYACALSVTQPIIVQGDVGGPTYEANQLFDIAKSSIIGGTLSGSNNVDGIIITWNATNQYNYDILVEGNEPVED